MSFDSASGIEQRSRSQIYPLFLLNLNCPRSLYDLTLEPSKTSVEFKMREFVWKNCIRRLSGQKRTTTYLDPEQELVMPEIVYQSLHNYADQNSKLGLDLQHSFSSFKIIYQELKSDSQATNICHTSCGSEPVIWFIGRI